MRYEQPRLWPDELDPAWGDLPVEMNGEELARCEQAMWRAFVALDITRALSLTTRSQAERHQGERDRVHFLAALLYGQCVVRDRRAGYR
jgi:hypothetical protein